MINIKIEGPTASGKSLVAIWIASQLKHAGADVILEDEFVTDPIELSDERMKVLYSILPELSIHIVTKQVNSQPSSHTPD